MIINFGTIVKHTKYSQSEETEYKSQKTDPQGTKHIAKDTQASTDHKAIGKLSRIKTNDVYYII